MADTSNKETTALAALLLPCQTQDESFSITPHEIMTLKQKLLLGGGGGGLHLKYSLGSLDQIHYVLLVGSAYQECLLIIQHVILPRMPVNYTTCYFHCLSDDLFQIRIR